MELWHWIAEHFPRHGVSSVGEFLAEYGPLIAGLSAIFFTLFEVILILRGHPKRKGRRISEHIRTFGLMFSVLLVTGLGLYTVQTKWMRKPAEIVWKERTEHILHNCLEKTKTPAMHATEQKLSKEYETPKLHCLAHAVQRASAAERATTGHSFSTHDFRTQIKRMDALLSIPDVPRILRASFSIDERFLGHGYSLPNSPNARYSDAIAHEYLIRNRCVTWSEPRCSDPKQISRQTFTWILDPADVSNDPNEKIRDLITRKFAHSREQSQDSQEARTAFALQLTNILERDRLKRNPPVLIRFAKFPLAGYLGTVGHPARAYVFFSNLAEMWDKSIAEAESASGRAAPTPVGGLTLFIWIYFPSGEDDARAATWDNVMHFLEHETKVDDEIARLAN